VIDLYHAQNVTGEGYISIGAAVERGSEQSYTFVVGGPTIDPGQGPVLVSHSEVHLNNVPDNYGSNDIALENGELTHVNTTNHDWVAFVGIAVGCLVFAFGNYRVDQMGGGHRKDASHTHEEGDAFGVVLGSVLDGIPESLVIGLTIARGGGVGAAYLIAVFISNVPEGISATSGLRSTWSAFRILRMWILIALVSGAASLFGYAFFDGTSDEAVAFVLTFAAGAILTMLADTMVPEAVEHAGALVGLVTVLGFTCAFLLSVAG